MKNLDLVTVEEIKARKIEREKTNTYAPRIAEFEYLLKFVEEQQKEIERLTSMLKELSDYYSPED